MVLALVPASLVIHGLPALLSTTRICTAVVAIPLECFFCRRLLDRSNHVRFTSFTDNFCFPALVRAKATIVRAGSLALDTTRVALAARVKVELLCTRIQLALLLQDVGRNLALIQDKEIRAPTVSAPVLAPHTCIPHGGESLCLAPVAPFVVNEDT